MRGEEEGWRKSLYLQKSIMEISNDFEKVFKRAQAPAVDALSLNNPPTLFPPPPHTSLAQAGLEHNKCRKQ